MRRYRVLLTLLLVLPLIASVGWCGDIVALIVTGMPLAQHGAINVVLWYGVFEPGGEMEEALAGNCTIFTPVHMNVTAWRYITLPVHNYTGEEIVIGARCGGAVGVYIANAIPQPPRPQVSGVGPDTYRICLPGWEITRVKRVAGGGNSTGLVNATGACMLVRVKPGETHLYILWIKPQKGRHIYRYILSVHRAPYVHVRQAYHGEVVLATVTKTVTVTVTKRSPPGTLDAGARAIAVMAVVTALSVLVALCLYVRERLRAS